MRQLFNWRFVAAVAALAALALLARAILTDDTSIEAVIEPELIELDWTAVPSLVRAVTSQRSLVVLATTIDTPGSSRGLLSVLPQLTRKHTVLVASVTDPTVIEATLSRANRTEVYLAAAGQRR